MLSLVLQLISVTHAALSSDTSPAEIGWSKVDGQLKEVVVSRDHGTGKRDLFGVSSNEQIWTCALPCDGSTNKWYRIPGAASHIAANEQEVWITKADYSIWRCERPCSGGNWAPVPGLLRSLTLSHEILWGVNMYDDVFRTIVRPKQAVAWQLMSPGAKFKWVSVGLDGDVWGVTNSGDVVRFSPRDSAWKPVPGKAKRVSVGRRHVYAIDENDTLSRCRRPCAEGKWQPVGNKKIRCISTEWAGRKIYGLEPDNTILEGSYPAQKCPVITQSKPHPANWWPWQRYVTYPPSGATYQPAGFQQHVMVPQPATANQTQPLPSQVVMQQPVQPQVQVPLWMVQQGLQSQTSNLWSYNNNHDSENHYQYRGRWSPYYTYPQQYVTIPQQSQQQTQIAQQPQQQQMSQWPWWSQWQFPWNNWNH